MTPTTTDFSPRRLIFWLVCLLLIFSPLIRAGNTAFALLVMQVMGLGILFVLGWGGLYRQRFPTAVWWFLIIGIGLLTLYLIPMPESWWRVLPGRELYAEVYDWLGEIGERDVYLAMSLVPSKTAYSMLALLPPLAIFLAVGCLNNQQIRASIYVFLGVAAFQAAWGLSQYAAGVSHSANGAYPSRDHFAMLMEMAFPLAAGLLAYAIGRKQEHDGYNVDRWTQKLNSALVFGSLALLLLLAGIFSRSRTGGALMLAGLLLSSLAFAGHIGGKRSASLTVVLGVLGFGVASTIGLIPVLNRFVEANPIEDERWRIADVTLQGIQQFFPLGSGLGTFADIYRAFQPIEQPGFVHNAHNDYLELLFETGVVGIGILIAFFALYGYGWWKLRKQPWQQERFIKTSAGIGVLLALLHAFVDFNFHIPANALFFAFLVGIFLKNPD